MLYKILLVDDDNEFRKEFKDSFSTYNVIEAPDGGTALRMLKKPNEIDLVILDVKMPGEKGTEILRKIKAMAPNLGIIILTGFSSKDSAIEAVKGHADDYIEKPFDVEELRDIMERILEGKRRDAGQGPSDTEDKIERVRVFLERNCFKKVTLSDAAGAVGLSTKYLSRIFKDSTGKGFSEYRLQIQVEKAKELLADTSYNVCEISDRLGYQNPESFIRQFKKLSGCTPTEFRKQSSKNK
jgi:two-component system, response regulator YesN